MRALLGFALALSFGCTNTIGGGGGADGADGGAATGPDAAPPGSPDAAPVPGSPDAAPGPRPGDGVEWLAYGEQNAQLDGSWGGVLTDIVQHCPPAWVSTYYDSDKVTHGHETSHGIHADLRNNFNDTGEQANGFYVLDDRAAIVIEPALRKSQIAPYVPAALRGSRYDLYITGQTAWDDTPLYVWDEWNAYVNGTAVAVDLVQAGMWSYGWRGACDGTIEFVVYALATGLAVEELDPDYFAGYAQFREFLAWNLRRSMELFRTCTVMEEFAFDWQDELYEDLRSHADAAPLREFVTRTWGAAFAAELLAP